MSNDYENMTEDEMTDVWWDIVKDQDVRSVGIYGETVRWYGKNLNGWNTWCAKKYLDLYLKRKGLKSLPNAILGSVLKRLHLLCLGYIRGEIGNHISKIECYKGYITIKNAVGEVTFCLTHAEWVHLFQPRANTTMHQT